MDLKNKTKPGFIIAAVVFLAAINCFGQDSPVVSSGDLQFYIDNASFMGKENKTYTEFYLMIFSDQLIDETSISDTMREFLVKSKISNISDGKVISDKQWFTNALLPRDSSSPNNTVVYDQWAELLGPGLYKAEITVTASKNKKSGGVELNLEVPKLDSSSFSISQIEFVSEVDDKVDGSPFIKGDKKILPNPWRRYGALNSRLSFFYEIYNRPNDVNLTGQYIITNDSGKTVKKLTGINFNHSSDLSVVHGINVSRLSTGTYDLNIILEDSSGNNSFVQSRKFEVIQLDTTKQAPGLSQEEAEIEGGLIKYTGTPAEYSFYEDLDLSGKTQYVINFWAEKDPSPGTPENEFLQKVMERFRYANQNFKWGKVPGWKTDRARVLIKYGMPEDIEQHTNEAGSKSYEIWTYNRDKTFIFIFADLNSAGNYSLIHSSKEGEVSNPGWREYLR